MKKILILVNQKESAKNLTEGLTRFPQNKVEVLAAAEHDLTLADTYQRKLTGVNVLISLLGPNDVDLDFEALLTAVDRAQPPLNLIIMLSTAGIDNEVVGKLNYPGVKDVKEYLNQQRYAVKLIDESEIPYTILRPVNVVNEKFGTPRVINEGLLVHSGNVSRETINQIIISIVVNGKYLNHSIALVEKRGDADD